MFNTERRPVQEPKPYLRDSIPSLHKISYIAKTIKYQSPMSSLCTPSLLNLYPLLQRKRHVRKKNKQKKKKNNFMCLEENCPKLNRILPFSPAVQPALRSSDVEVTATSICFIKTAWKCPSCLIFDLGQTSYGDLPETLVCII